MEDLLIEPTKNTPLVDFSGSGKMVLAGNAQAENAREFFDPVVDWITDLRIESVDFDVVLDYINTASAKRLLEILRKLDTNTFIKSLKINWYYDKDDEDHLETGQILSDTLSKAQFRYVEVEK